MRIVYSPLIIKYLLDRGFDLRLLEAAIDKAAGLRTAEHFHARIPGFVLQCEISEDSIRLVSVSPERPPGDQ